MSSLGFQTIYREIHAHPGCSAERAFLPDDPDGWRSSGVPLLTYEGLRPVAELPLIALSVSYELEVASVCELLDLAGLPVLAERRDESHPLVVAGGPLTFSNPLPLAPFVDVLLLGEAEDLVHELLDLVLERLPRAELLDRLAARAGFHVPGRSAALGAVARAPDDRLPARSQVITPDTELRSMFLIEPERGCSRGCTYCVMRRTTNGGMRTVSPERVLELIPAEVSRVGLVGAAVTDHPRLPELLAALVEGGKQASASSLRADRLDREVVTLLARAGARSLTTAADGASERLRRALDRKTTEAQLLRVAQLVREARLAHLKLYLMLGIPGESDADVDELVRLGREISKIVPLVFGVSPFVAKRNTPMDGAPFEPIASMDAKLARLRRGLRGKADVRATSARWAWVEYQLAQGGPEAGLAAMDAWRAGGTFSAWKRAVAERGVRPRESQRVADGRLRLPQLALWPSVGAA
ncbi:MAG: radical SAM protein [Myxococcales bacterium]